MIKLTDKELADLRAADVHDAQCERAHDEIVQSRAALRRLELVISQLERREGSSMDRYWAAELRAALTGRKSLYRCPVHGDRRPSAQRAERGSVVESPSVALRGVVVRRPRSWSVR